MNQQQSEFDNINLLFEKCKKVLTNKKHDYAKDNDRFSNFRVSSSFAQVRVEQSLLVMIGTKMARLSELLNKDNGAAPKNEPVIDTIEDAINYLGLLYDYLLTEKSSGKKCDVK